jgi:hypothetical protein
MRLLVCGPRGFRDFARLCAWLDLLAPTVLIHGDAVGADRLAGRWGANRAGVEVLVFPANWEQFGKAAGHLRNARMLREGLPDMVLPCPNGGPGTRNMVKQARLAGVPVLEVQ